MEDGISNPGIPLSRAFVPVSPSGGTVTGGQHVTSQGVNASVPGPQRTGASPAADLQKTDPSSKTRGDTTTQGVADSVAVANAIAAFLDTKMSFTYDERIERIVVKVTEGDHEEVIRQIPSEEMIQLTLQLRKDFRGLIFNRTG